MPEREILTPDLISNSSVAKRPYPPDGSGGRIQRKPLFSRRKLSNSTSVSCTWILWLSMSPSRIEPILGRPLDGEVARSTTLLPPLVSVRLAAVEIDGRAVVRERVVGALKHHAGGRVENHPAPAAIVVVEKRRPELAVHGQLIDFQMPYSGDRGLPSTAVAVPVAHADPGVHRQKIRAEDELRGEGEAIGLRRAEKGRRAWTARPAGSRKKTFTKRGKSGASRNTLIRRR